MTVKHRALVIRDSEWIDVNRLPEEVADELEELDHGKVINPEYHERFKDWLVKNDLTVKTYLLLRD